MFEKKRGKRFLASVMALVMLLSLAPVGALAAKGGNDNESYVMQDTFNIEGNVTYYELSGQSTNNFTEARYIWENDGSVYLAFIVSYGQGNNKPILSATASTENLTVGDTLYNYLQFGSSSSILATGKGEENARWQIATYEGSIQDLLNTGNTLTISTQHQGNGYNLNGVEYTVEDYPDPSEPGEGGGTPGGPDGDGDQQGTTDNVKVTYNANFEDATIEYKVPAETSVPTGADVTISKWTQGEQAVAVEDSAVTATKDGETYEFKGWSTTQSEPAEGSSLYVAGNNLTVDRDIMLYAIWEEKKVAPQPDPTPDSPQLVTAMFFINLGGKDASNREGIGEFTGPITIDDALNYTLFKEKKSTDMSSNKGYIFNENGVETPYPSLLNKEPTYEQINEKIPADKQGSMSVGDDTGREVVWYHVSHCGDGYHVDGYIKNVAITITYDPNGGSFGEEVSTVNGKHTEPGTTGIPHKIIRDVPQKAGYTFTGWKLKDKDSEAIYQFNGSITPTGDVTLVAQWEKDTPTPTEPENPTSEINAKYFVLTPSITAPTDGSSQGVGNYFPNDSDCGGVEGKTTSTGYPGKIKSTLLNKYPKVNTQAGYADTTNGIGADDLVLPDDLGYFSRANYTDGVYTGYNKDSFPDVLKNLVGEGNQFNMNNYQIVWYVAKLENDGYHVDGYLKGVSIQLKYIDTFGGTKTEVKSVPNLKSGDKVTIESQNIIAADRTGWTFEGWTTNADGTGKLYRADDKEILITSTSLYAKWTNTYTVVTHFKDAEGTEQKNLEQTRENLTGTSGKLLKDLVVNPDLKKIQGTYVYVPSETSYSVDEVDKGKVGDATFTEANTVIHQYYYLDKTGKTDEKGKDTNEPNNYPDAWEYKATFIVKNGQWDTNPTGGKDTIVKYLPTKNIKTGESIQAKLSNVPTAGNTPDSHYKAGSWDQKPNEDGVITEDMTYTYTYSWRSSGGSGGSNRPKPPVVDIPDDVPTGLNGKDHYAYIIGYGNNDVRPQNNITRAEVATIFFRLLTDETREANMTKSNSYNDVKDGDWFCCAVSTLSKMGIIKGYEDGSFKPDQEITRAETMTLVNRVLNRLPETKDDLHKDMKTWVDNMDETAWYYLAVQEATNSHYFKNKTGTKFEQWTELRDTRDWSELEK